MWKGGGGRADVEDELCTTLRVLTGVESSEKERSFERRLREGEGSPALPRHSHRNQAKGDSSLHVL